MDYEFHYWVTGILAARAGFSADEASTIAYAANYTDDNVVEMNVEHQDREKAPYHVYISQTMDIFQPQSKRMIVYPCFHFVPGDPLSSTAYRKDGKMHVLNTTPGNANAVALMESALNSTGPTRLYRIGIAAHAFADTWSHQNFVGYKDGFNAGDFKLAPKIGHAEAKSDPDKIAHVWQDDRLLEPEVDNNQRFLEAARSMFEIFSGHTGEGGDIETVLAGLGKAFGKPGAGSGSSQEVIRCAEYSSLARDCFGYDWLPEYNPKNWLTDVVDIDIRGLEDGRHGGIFAGLVLLKDKYYWRKDRPDYQERPWYLFQEAVKEHQNEAITTLSPTFSTMGISMDQLKDWADD